MAAHGAQASRVAGRVSPSCHGRCDGFGIPLADRAPSRVSTPTRASDRMSAWRASLPRRREKNSTLVVLLVRSVEGALATSPEGGATRSSLVGHHPDVQSIIEQYLARRRDIGALVAAFPSTMLSMDGPRRQRGQPRRPSAVVQLVQRIGEPSSRLGRATSTSEPLDKDVRIRFRIRRPTPSKPLNCP